MPGLWPLRGSNPPLFTKKAADVIIHKATKREYIRGNIQLFDDDKIPPVVESTGEYEFVYFRGNKSKSLTRDDMLKEAYTGAMLNNLKK